MSALPQLAHPQTSLPAPQEFTLLKEVCSHAIKSGLLPQGIKTPEAALIIALKGREMGVPPMQAFSHIHVISGKPSISSELMLAMIYKNCPGAVVNIAKTDSVACEIEAKRPGGRPSHFIFSMNDAKTAGVTGNQTWQKYPAAMLRARCISAMARAMFPDAIMGCSYTPEELGAETNEDGEVVAVVESAPLSRREETNKKIEVALQTIEKGPQPKIPPSEYVVNFGTRYFGKRLSDMTIEQVKGFRDWLIQDAERSCRAMSNFAVDFVDAADAYLKKFVPLADNIPY